MMPKRSRGRARPLLSLVPGLLLAQVVPQAQGPTGWTSWLILPGLSVETELKLVGTVFAAVALMLLRRGAVALIAAKVEDPALRYKWSKAAAYTAFFIGLLVVVQIWFTAIRSLGTFLGLVSAGLAIALKDIVADFAGWLFILWRRPFEPGDRIEIGGNAGDVIDTRIFQFTLLEIGKWVAADQSTGRIIHVPNQAVFTQPLANYTTGFAYLWNELPVLVTFESDWRRAKRVLEAIAMRETRGVSEEARRELPKASKRYLIHYRKFTPAVYTSVQDSGVLLTIRYLCRPRERRGTAQILWEQILEEFEASPDIELAYPTQRIYLGPEGLRAGGPLSGGPSRE